MTDYAKLDMEIYDLILKKYGKKYDVSYTGTSDPEWYETQKKNGLYTGLEIFVRVKDK